LIDDQMDATMRSWMAPWCLSLALIATSARGQSTITSPVVSPWWGTATPISPPDSVTVLYDSGLQYVGSAAQAAVSLYASSGATTPLVTTGSTVQIGQMGQINKVDTANPSQVISTNWDANGSTTVSPPIDSRFFGDFGMNLAANPIPNASGIVNLIAQLDYGPGVTRAIGFAPTSGGNKPGCRSGSPPSTRQTRRRCTSP
jgi:hypothetical protein